MPRYRTARDVASYIRGNGRKTMYITKNIADLSTFNVPSAGPRPNLTGMRSKYWGKDAIIGLQSGYAYKLAGR